MRLEAAKMERKSTLEAEAMAMTMGLNGRKVETVRELVNDILEQAADNRSLASSIQVSLFGFRPQDPTTEMKEPESIEDLLYLGLHILRETNITLSSVRDRLS